MRFSRGPHSLRGSYCQGVGDTLWNAGKSTSVLHKTYGLSRAGTKGRAREESRSLEEEQVWENGAIRA